MITSSPHPAYRRQPFFASPESRRVFERCLEATRVRYGFAVDAYVIMPEHVHLLVSEPAQGDLSVVLQALKISVARKFTARPLWQRRFYDFNVFTGEKRIEKRRYIHRNPFTRGLVAHPADWVGSSYRHWACGEQGIVQLASTWTYAEQLKRQAVQTSCEPTSRKTEMWGTQTSKVERAD
ncbi:MAG: REP-associated tyrosine transposase [Acidobacteriota bacterium]